MRAKIQGFIVWVALIPLVLSTAAHCSNISFDYAKQYSEARKEIGAWLKDGSCKRRFHVVKGLQNAPEALNLLFSGGNTGKLYVFLVPAYFEPELTRPSHGQHCAGVG